MDATPTFAEGFLGNEPSELLYSMSQYVVFLNTITHYKERVKMLISLT
uniref:Uncharacterized protein n=1 Tax=Ackermannviridae sp. ctaCq7 TaxID=2827294 RepID=A0A8S5R6L1_9CAUD|nr:MAG TPA: hypothetical protein [Ackermannviridae sp. ctaCq7]